MNVMGNCRKGLILNIEVFFGVVKILVYALPLHVLHLKKKFLLRPKYLILKFLTVMLFGVKEDYAIMEQLSDIGIFISSTSVVFVKKSIRSLQGELSKDALKNSFSENLKNIIKRFLKHAQIP